MKAPVISLQTSLFLGDFVDVAEVNSHVSRALAGRVTEVSELAREGEHAPAKAFVVLGPAGGGKTHIFARLRHHPELRATLVLLRPFFGVSLTPRNILAAVIDQLCIPLGESLVSPLDALATYWLTTPENVQFPAAAAESRKSLSEAEWGVDLDRATARLLLLLPDAEPVAHLIRALFQIGALTGAARWAELAWLSGREPRHDQNLAGDALEASAAGLSETDIAHLLRIVSVIAAPTAPLILTFDQLENLSGDDDTRVLAFGNLVGELVDTIPSLTVAQLALTSEWMQFIEPRLSLPQRTRVMGELLTLEAPNRGQRDQLLRAWYMHMDTSLVAGKKKRFPAPLTPEQLEHLLSAPGMTPRLLLAALVRAIDGKVDPFSTATEPAQTSFLWLRELAEVQTELRAKSEAGLVTEAAELAEGLSCALSFVPALVVTTRAERDRLLTHVCTPGHELTLMYLTGMHHSSVASTLVKAIELAHTGKTVLARERGFDIKASWSAVNERRTEFEGLPNARWLWLETDELAQCIALARLLSRVRAKRLRTGNGEELMTEAELRTALSVQAAPQAWRAVASMVLWLSDVPRASSAAAERRSEPRTASVPHIVHNAFKTGDPATTSEELPSLREWLRVGQKVGRKLIQRYTGRLPRLF